jgi:plasmid stabilization system protein ParE
MIATYAPRAYRDLEAIAEYLVHRSPSGAARVLAAIRSSIATLEAFPEIGPVVDDFGRRKLSVSRFPYVIYYRMREMKF